MKYLIYLNWPEVCFRVNAADLAAFRDLVGGEASVEVVRDDAAFLAALPEATHVLTWHFRSEWYALAPKLKLVATPAAGRELIAQDAPSGVCVHFCHFHGAIISEAVLGFALAWKHGFFHRTLVPLWPRAGLSPFCGDMAGTHAVIFGYGRIGRAIGARFEAFGVSVFGYARHLAIQPATLDAELARADWLVVALPSDTGTTDLVDAALLAKLPPRCVVINVGRGNAVDETALVDALRAGRLAGAYLDVYKNEPTLIQPKVPPPGFDIANADAADLPPTLIRMPHASAYSPSYLKLFFKELKDEGLI